MASVNSVLPEFPGFAVQYDPAMKPYFVTSVVEAMRIVVSKPIGASLVAEIAAARPSFRTPGATSKLGDIQFPIGINVVVVPAVGGDAVTWSQSTMKMGYGAGSDVKNVLVPSSHEYHNQTYRRTDGTTEVCAYHMDDGGSVAEAYDVNHTTDGQGTVSVMKFTNAQIQTRKGEKSWPFIVLAHELIHCLHHVTGTKLEMNEEPRSVGFPPYDTETYTEQKFRAAFNLPPRNMY